MPNNVANKRNISNKYPAMMMVLISLLIISVLSAVVYFVINADTVKAISWLHRTSFGNLSAALQGVFGGAVAFAGAYVAIKIAKAAYDGFERQQHWEYYQYARERMNGIAKPAIVFLSAMSRMYLAYMTYSTARRHWLLLHEERIDLLINSLVEKDSEADELAQANRKDKMEKLPEVNSMRKSAGKSIKTSDDVDVDVMVDKLYAFFETEKEILKDLGEGQQKIGELLNDNHQMTDALHEAKEGFYQAWIEFIDAFDALASNVETHKMLKDLSLCDAKGNGVIESKEWLQIFVEPYVLSPSVGVRDLVKGYHEISNKAAREYLRYTSAKERFSRFCSEVFLDGCIAEKKLIAIVAMIPDKESVQKYANVLFCEYPLSKEQLESLALDPYVALSGALHDGLDKSLDALGCFKREPGVFS